MNDLFNFTGLGTVVNVILIIAGGVVGIVFKKLLPSRLAETIMNGLGLAVIIVGLSGVFSATFTVNGGEISTQHTLIIIISLALGAITGELVKIEDKLNSVAEWCKGRFPSSDEGFTQGLVTATLVFCVGSMSILGAIEDGINQNHDILFAKSVLDGVSAMVFASAMGAGVLFSAVPVALYQGAITLLAMFISPYLDAGVVSQMSAVGSVLIMGIGFNMLKITKIKVGNLLPAMLVPVIYYIICFFIK